MSKIFFCVCCYEFIFRYHDLNNELSLRAIKRKNFGGKFWNSMRRQLVGKVDRRWLVGEVDQMGRASGGRGKKRAIRGRGRGRSRLASNRDRAIGKMNILSFCRYHEQNIPGWPKDRKKLSIRSIAKKYKVPYTSLQKRIAGMVSNMAPSSGRGKGNPHILSKSVEGKQF